MATADNRTDLERRNLIELASQQYLGRPFGDEGWAAFQARPDMTVEQRIGEMMVSPEAQAYNQRRLAESSVSPITGQEQAGYLAEAQRTLAPLQAAFASTIEQQKKSAQQEYADTETRLREAAAAEKQGVGVELSNRGFLRSGEQIGRFEQIGKNLISDISKADINRAIQEANLVLQQVQFDYDMGQKAATAAQTRTEQEFTSRSRTAELNRLRYEQQDALASGNIDRYLQLEETARQREAQLQEQEHERQMQEMRIRQAEMDMQRANTDVITAGGRVKLIDRQTGQVIADLGSATTGTGGGGGSRSTSSKDISSLASYTPTQQRDMVAKAITILSEEDTGAGILGRSMNPEDTGDKLLSKEQQEAAYQRIVGEVGDANLAYEVMIEAMRTGGFGDWAGQEG